MKTERKLTNSEGHAAIDAFRASLNPPPPKAGQAQTADDLPAYLRLIRSHPDAATRLGLLELVAHDHQQFGYEDGMFFAAPEGSLRARIAQACVDRYNAHSSLLASHERLKQALTALEAWVVHTSGEVPEIRECGTYRTTLANAYEALSTAHSVNNG